MPGCHTLGMVAGPIGPPPPHIVQTEVEGDVSLYNPRREEVAILNATASDIWSLGDGTLTLEEIVERLARAYARPPDEIRDEVQDTVQALIEGGFLTSDAT
ncbi:MAG: PqqD family protein [Acidimicrobiia bacterium]